MSSPCLNLHSSPIWGSSQLIAAVNSTCTLWLFYTIAKLYIIYMNIVVSSCSGTTGRSQTIQNRSKPKSWIQWYVPALPSLAIIPLKALWPQLNTAHPPGNKLKSQYNTVLPVLTTQQSHTKSAWPTDPESVLTSGCLCACVPVCVRQQETRWWVTDGERLWHER